MGSDELLFGVCAGGRLVGASSAALDERYSNVARQVRLRSLPLVESVEQAVALRPDIVFVASYSSAEQVDLLRATGMGVFRLSNFDRIEGVMGNIRAVGYAVGEDRCARDLVAEMKQRIDAISRLIPAQRTPRVMMYGTAGYTEGANTLIDDLFKVVGARNVAAEHGVVGTTRINAEAITMWQPDYLVIGAAREDFDRVRRAMLADPAIARSLATRSGVVLLDEPTANLDPAHAIDVLELCRFMAKHGKVVVLSIQDLSLAIRYAPRVALLSAGSVAGFGTWDEVMTDAAVCSVFGILTRRAYTKNGECTLLFDRANTSASGRCNNENSSTSEY